MTAPSTIFQTAVIRPLDYFARMVGLAVAWLTLAMGVVTLVLVVARYGFQFNSVALQESIIYMHSLVLLLGAAMTLRADGHVRVDIFYRRQAIIPQAWVNAVGGIVFLLPFCGFITFISLHYVSSSWQDLEGSSEPGGIPAVFLLKTLIPVTGFFLALQGVAEILRSALCLVEPAQSKSPRIDSPQC